jgi:hypothetical protein
LKSPLYYKIPTSGSVKAYLVLGDQNNYATKLIILLRGKIAAILLAPISPAAFNVGKLFKSGC